MSLNFFVSLDMNYILPASFLPRQCREITAELIPLYENNARVVARQNLTSSIEELKIKVNEGGLTDGNRNQS